MKNILVVSILIFLFVHNFHSQEIQINWSEKVRRFFLGDGTFNKYVGETDKYVYATFLRSNKVNLIQFEKKEMLKADSYRVRGFKENFRNIFRFVKHTYLNTIITDSNIFVFWNRMRIGTYFKKEKVYVTCYDHSFNLKYKNREIYSYEHTLFTTPSKKHEKTSLFVFYNPGYSQNILVGSEQKGVRKVTVNYTLFSGKLDRISDFSNDFFHNDRQLLTSSYTISHLPGDKILVKQYCPIIYTENLIKKLLKFRHDNTPHLACTYFSVINTRDGKEKSYPLSDHTRLMHDVSFDVLGNKLLFSGGWNDYVKNPYGDSLTGYFYATIQGDEFIASHLNQVRFEKSQLDSIYGSKSVKSEEGLFVKYLFQKEKELLENIPTVEKGVFTSDSSIAIVTSNTFFDVMDPYSTEKVYYSQHFFKRNINVMNINLRNDKVIWNKEIKRNVTYYNPFINDISIFRKDSSLFMFYGDGDFSIKDIPLHSLVNEKTQLGHAVVNLKDGKYKSHLTLLDHKSMFPGEIYELNKSYYLRGFKYQWIPLYWSSFFGRITF